MALCGVVASGGFATEASVDVNAPRSAGFAAKKHAPSLEADAPDLLGTLVQTHTDEHVALDDALPTAARFEELLADRATGQHHAIDPRLLDIVRQLARRHLGARIEIVSGYRSEKLNEVLRKKGHHVATHSQHTLGHALDFRIVGVSPSDTERELRDLGWAGGIGVYLSDSDRFTHADVGPSRRWNGL